MKLLRLSVVALLLVVFQSQALVPEIERQALVALYHATNGENWTENSNWLVGDPCDNAWEGVSCGSGLIFELDLGRNNLVGSIPPEIGNLANLSWIELDTNQLSGSIPSEIGNLTNLERLDFRDNQLSGTIPVSIGNMTNLQTITLWKNQLTGTIPVEISNLNNLTSLQLFLNNLTGNIPVELTELPLLSSISIGGNQFSGNIPVELANLNLTFFDIQNSGFSGEIPTELCTISTLEHLALGGNPLTGTIPACLGNLTALRRLYLQETELTGQIPIELTNLINLDRLYLYTNQFTGPIHPEFGLLTGLKRFLLDNNQLTGTIPAQLGTLPVIEDLWLDSNQLEGSIPQELGNLTSLRVLRLQKNKLTGIVPSSLKNLPNLRIPEPGFWFELDKSSVQYNAVSTDDAELDAFLDTYCVCDWSASQTLTPENLSVVSSSDESVSLTWDVIEYLNDSGGYNILQSDTINGTYTQVAQIPSKALNLALITGLNLNTAYFFKIEAFTDVHQNNQNQITSEPSTAIPINTDAVASGDVNLWVDMQVPSGLLPAGQTTQYLINLGNDGPEDALSATFFHVIPNELSNVSWSCEAFAGASCPTENRNNLADDISENIDLPMGSSVTFTITADVTETEVVSPLTASIALPNSVNDTMVSNNYSVNNIQIGIFGNGFE